MLKAISKSGFFIQLLILLTVAVFFWMRSFVLPVAPIVTAADGYLYTLFLQLISHNTVVSVVLAFFMTLLFSLSFAFVLSENDLNYRNNLLVSVLLMSFLSWNQSITTLSSVSFALLPLLFAFNQTMRLYEESEAYGRVFAISFAISFASLFFTPLIYLFVFIWLSFILYRILVWREWVISLIGGAIPYIYLVSILFLTSKQSYMNTWYLTVFNVTDSFPIWELKEKIWLALVAVLGFICFFGIFSSLNEKLIALRRRTLTIINFLLAGFICIGLFYSASHVSFLLLAVPLSFFIATSIFTSKKQYSFQDIYASLLLIALVLFRLV